jgi:hypothetical protein
MRTVMGMDARLVAFGSVEVDGQRYDQDVVIDGGVVRKRKKKPSKPYRDEFGHTPLSVDEDLPWGGSHLIVGTGAGGSLPVMQDVVQEAARRDVDLVVVPTAQACTVIAGLDPGDVFAVLHVTC